MSNCGAFYLASNVGGKIEKTQVKSAVKKYEKYHVGGDDEEREANYTDMVNKLLRVKNSVIGVNTSTMTL